MKKKLGDIITYMEPSLSEKDRIGNLLKEENSLQTEIIKTRSLLINDENFWRWAHKYFKIKGFRIGNIGAKQLIVKKALDSLKVNKGSENRDVWMLYRRCITYYVVHELPNLNKLISEESIDDDIDNLTYSILKSINEKAPLYNVTDKEVKELYDLWWFERINNLDGIFQCDRIDYGIINKLIAKEIGGLSDNLENKLKLIGKDNQVNNNVTKEINELKSKLDKFNIERLEKKIHELISSDLKQLKNELTTISDLINKFSIRLKELEENNDNSVEFESFRNKLNDIYNRYNNILNVINDIKNSNIIQNKNSETNKSMDITLKELMHKIIINFNKIGLKETNNDIVCGLLTLVAGSDIVITDKPEIIINMLNPIPSVYIKSIVASPLWVSEKDWVNDVRSLEGNNSKINFIVIRDFDIGIQETYLIPVLLRWINVKEEKIIKVILVPSGKEQQEINPRLIGMSSNIDFSHETVESLILFGSSINSESNIKRVLEKRVDEFFSPTKYINIEFERQIQNLVKDYELPKQVLSNFVGLYEYCNQYSNSDRNISFAARFTIYPWLNHTHGEIAKRRTEEYINSIFMGGTHE